MADARLTIAGREVRSLVDEKTILLAIAIQLFVAAFSSFLVVGLVSLSDPGSAGANVEIEAAVAGDDVSDLTAALRDTPGIEPIPVGSRDAATDAFADGRVEAAILASRVAEGRTEVRVLAPDANVRTTVIVLQVRRALQTYERAERADRADSLTETTLDLPAHADGSPYFGFTYTVLVPLLLFLPVFIAGSITVDSLTEELDRGTMELLRVAPVSVTEIVEGKLLASAGLAPLQAAAWMLLLSANGTRVANLPALLALVAGAGAIVTVVGATLALVSPDRRAAQTIYSLGMLALFGAAALTPANPANVAAVLAVDSAGTTEYAVAVGSLALGAFAVVFARRVVSRYAVSTR